MVSSVPSRPCHLSPEMAERAATKIVDGLIRDGHIEEMMRADAIRDLARHGARYPRADGYELAKTLDERADWECDLQMAEALDGWSFASNEEIKQAQRAWMAQHNIQPPLPAGSRVIARWGSEDHVGTIDEIYAHGVAQYAVKRDGEAGSSRMIVNFEDVRLVEAEASTDG